MEAERVEAYDLCVSQPHGESISPVAPHDDGRSRSLRRHSLVAERFAFASGVNAVKKTANPDAGSLGGDGPVVCSHR
jgi:hypothetical protein